MAPMKLKTMNKKQKTQLVKAFRMLKAGAEKGEDLARLCEISDDAVRQLVEHVSSVLHLVSAIEQGLGQHIVASKLLAKIDEKRGKPQLRLVKGGV